MLASQQIRDPLKKDIHVGVDRVGRQARASGAAYPECANQRLGAMMAAAQRNPPLVQEPANVVRGEPLD